VFLSVGGQTILTFPAFPNMVPAEAERRAEEPHVIMSVVSPRQAPASQAMLSKSFSGEQS